MYIYIYIYSKILPRARETRARFWASTLFSCFCCYFGLRRRGPDALSAILDCAGVAQPHFQRISCYFGLCRRGPDALCGLMARRTERSTGPRAGVYIVYCSATINVWISRIYLCTCIVYLLSSCCTCCLSGKLT